MQLTLGEVAERLGATLDGDPGTPVTGVAGLAEAGEGDVSFLADIRYVAAAAGSRATAVLVPRDFQGRLSGAALRVDSPYAAFVELAGRFHVDRARPEPGIHPSATVDPSARLAPDVAVGAGAVIGSRVSVGAGSWVGAGAVLGADVRVGGGCEVHPLVHLRHGVVLGDRVIVQSGAVIGSDGFGYVSGAEGHRKIPHLGSVVVGDDVEIGANTAIDRGTLGNTVIEDGVKIDNLVHIAHNVTVGRASLLVAQVGISGSTRVGRGAVLGGQAGLVGHIRVGDGARVGAQAGVTKSVEDGHTVSGYPAMEHVRARRLQGHIRRLPDLVAQLKRLEARVRELEKTEEGIR